MALAIKEVTTLECEDWALAAILYAADKTAFRGATPGGTFTFGKTDKVAKALEACGKDATKPSISFSDLQEWCGKVGGKKVAQKGSNGARQRKTFTAEMEKALKASVEAGKDKAVIWKEFQETYREDCPKEQTLRKKIAALQRGK